MRIRLGVLASGAGTNFQALLAASADPGYPCEVAVLVTDRRGIGALDRAHAAGIPVAIVRLEDHPSRETFTSAVAAALTEHEVKVVASAGFLKLLSPPFFAAFPDAVVNVHPSLLPSFPGPLKRVLRETLAAGVKVSGVTVHLLDEGVDTGPILLQECVPVLADDTMESLHARLQVLEHRLFPEGVALVARGLR